MDPGDGAAAAMTKTVLLTLGRLPKGLELARALHGAGARVIVADPFRRHVAKVSNAVAAARRVRAPAQGLDAYLADLRDVIERDGVDLVVPISEEAACVTQLAHAAPPGVSLFGPSAEQYGALHDKLSFNRMAAAMGLSAPETFRGDDPQAAALAARGDYVVKPTRGASGRRLSFHQRGAPLPATARAAGMAVQRRVRGREISSLTIAHKGRVLGSVLYRGLIFAGTVACCFERVDAPAAARWIERFVEGVDYSGFIAFDFFVDADGRPQAIECNPRLTSGIHFFDPGDLAACVLGAPRPVGFKPQRAFQEGHTALTMTYAQFKRPRRALAQFRSMARARDVLWSPRDPAPFALMTPMSWEILRPVIFSGLTFGEAAMRDLSPPDRASEAAAQSDDRAPSPSFAAGAYDA